MGRPYRLAFPRPALRSRSLRSTLNRYVLLLLSTAVLWSLGGVLVKSIDLTPFTIAGSRSLIATVIMAVAMHRTIRRISWQTIPGAIAYSFTVFLFVVATKLTTAANAIFLQYTAPVYIALISPWYLREHTAWHDWLLVVIALCGIALFFLDRLSLQGLSGVIAALASGVSFAWLTVLMRRQRAPATNLPPWPSTNMSLTLCVRCWTTFP